MTDPDRCNEPLVKGVSACALRKGHFGPHVPLEILWQEAGYAEGPWAPDEVRRRLRRKR